MGNGNWGYVIASSILSLAIIIANVQGVFLGDLGYKVTVSDSIYATLTTILLALLALAVTAYIFLATALKERRERYEQKTVEKMLAVRTRNLLYLTIFGIVSLLACFLIDNANTGLQFPPCLHIVTITVSSIVCVLLMIYICTIITYEHGLETFAHRERRKLFPSTSENRMKIMPMTLQRGGNAQKASQDASEFLKSIDDLEMLVMTLVANHKDNFHGTDVSDTILVIIKDKSGQPERFIETYDKLISYRDFLRVEQQKTGKIIKITDDEYNSVQKAIEELEDGLKTEYLAGERLKNLNFVAPFLQKSKKQFVLKATAFSDSAFEDTNFRKASLAGADFSRTRLNGVNFEDADCTEAVFSESVFREIKVNVGSRFENAVFRNTDFGRQKFCTDDKKTFCFKSASFVRANLIECIFSTCDFRYANFNCALMTSIDLNSVCLSYADLSQAILTSAKLHFEMERADCFPLEENGDRDQINTEGSSPFCCADAWRGQRLGDAFFANLERSTLSQAYISAYNFTGSRMADANFSDAYIENCLFDRCYGQQATFQEATIQFCRFQYAMFATADFSYAEITNCDFSDINLRDCLMVKATIQGNKEGYSCFRRANFTNAQLRGCIFADCDFREARFTDADLLGAVFRNCDLTGAVFDGTDQDSFMIENCIGYSNTLNVGQMTMAQDKKSLSLTQIIQRRKSTRSFDSSCIIEKDSLDCILQAALQAPSPKNRQPWHFTVVAKKETQEELARILERKLNELRADRIKLGKSTDDLDLAKGSVRVLRDASALAFVTYIRDEENEHGDPHEWNLSAQPFEVADLQSIGASVENMLLTADMLSIDSLWMCDVLYAYRDYMQYLNLKYPLIACVALGHQALYHTPKASLDEKVEYWN